MQAASIDTFDIICADGGLNLLNAAVMTQVMVCVSWSLIASLWERYSAKRDNPPRYVTRVLGTDRGNCGREGHIFAAPLLTKGHHFL